MAEEIKMKAIQIDSNAALIVIDVQVGFDDPAFLGKRNNPSADENIQSLIKQWEKHRRPIVVVQHNSKSATSSLHPFKPGNFLKPYVKAITPALRVTKTVNSAFYGEPDLHQWLQGENIKEVVIIGIQTNMCCETTARMAGNLGYNVIFVPDAMHTFDLEGPNGEVLTADELSRATVINLHGGGFAKIALTSDLTADDR
ncbi:MAG TPA: cysteine hydrolase family protein [Candidatus Nanopelagicaceae bacterium]